MRLRYIDLFSGIGGFRLAAEAVRLPRVKLQAVAACDSDPNCKRLYFEAFQPQELFVDDVRLIKTHNGNSEGVQTLPPFELLLAGFPCQPFANIGRGGGLSAETR